MAPITKAELDKRLFQQNRVILEVLPDQPSNGLDQFILNSLFMLASANMGSGYDSIQASSKLEGMRGMTYRQMCEAALMSPDYADYERQRIGKSGNCKIHLYKPIPETGRRLTQSEVHQVAKQGIHVSVSDTWTLHLNEIFGAEIQWKDSRTNVGARALWYVNIAQPEVPNLDSMEPENLLEFWNRHQGGRNQHFLLPKGGKGSRRAVADLANYAANKSAAMRSRLDGNVQTALEYESICQSIYDGLPATARW